MALLEMSAHMTGRPGCLDGFKKQAAECIRVTKELDTELCGEEGAVRTLCRNSAGGRPVQRLNAR